MDKCSDKSSISSIVVTTKRDKTIKLAIIPKSLKKAKHKNEYLAIRTRCGITRNRVKVAKQMHTRHVS